jgi:glycosyltransferase 2 family protein
LRDKLINLLKIVISIGLVFWAFSKIDLKLVGAQLAAANPWSILAALALFETAIIINGVKWQVLLRAQGVRVPFGALLQFLFMGFFFNNFLPANVGGDVIRGYGLARYTDRAADAAVSVVVDRIVGLIAYMSTAFAAAVIVVNLNSGKDLRQLEWVAFVALLALLVGFAVLLSRRVRAMLSRFFAMGLLSPLAPLWNRISGAFDAYRFQYRALALAFGLGLLGIVCTAFVNWFLSQSMGGGMPLPTIFLLNPLIALTLMLPISIGGIGVSQAAYPFFYGLAGVPPSHALAVSLLMQALMIIGSLPGAFFWLRGRRQGTTEVE